jgi:drug/metabolite transporter (DMT)-like permease
MNPIIALIIANSIWGAGAPIFKRALIDVPPFTLAFLRFAGATFIMLPFYSQFRQKVSARDLFQIAIIAIFGITINISFFFLGLQKAPSINAPIIGSSGPIFLYLLSILFLNEKFKLKTYSARASF